MGVSTRSIGEALREIAGRSATRDDPAALAAAAVDGTTPRWVVRPATVEGVGRVLALAHDAGLAVAPRGRGTTLTVGAPPSRLDVVLDLGGLDGVLDYRPDDLTVSVQAGVTAGTLNDAVLESRRQRLPIDPVGWHHRSLGGITATNASGPLRARYGTMRDLLLGVRFVQADGVVTWGGAQVVKSVTGYDVPKLMVGSLGTLGVLVELTLRLHPAPEFEQTWVAGFSSPERAQRFVAGVTDSTLEPNRVELLNGAALRACGMTPAGAGVAVSVGSVDAAVRAQGSVIADLARDAGGAAAPAPDDFWRRYDTALVPGEREVVLHVSSPASRLADTWTTIERSIRALDAVAVVTGCAVLGTFRLVVTGAEPGPAARLVEELRGFVAPLGGSVVVAAGPRALREHIDPWGPVEPGALALMRALKDEFDPTRVLNPGRFVGGL